jgi:hypothetical protein
MHGSVFVFVPLASLLARVSLLAMFLSFAAYTAAYVVLLARYRLPAWESPAEFLRGRGEPWFRLLTFCQACALLTPLFFVVFCASLSASVAPEYAAPALVGLCAAVAFAAFSSVYYVVQLRLGLWAGDDEAADGLAGLFQLNPTAVFSSVNVLAWTAFFGAASLWLAPLFLASGGAGASLLGVLLALNGVVCLLGLAGYFGRVRALNVLYFNGMGLTVLVFSLVGALIL